MAEFPSWRSFWNFQRDVARARRFIRTPETEQFLTCVRTSCHERAKSMPKGFKLWRAQLGHGWRREDAIDGEVPCAYGTDRMKPLPDRAYEGRANPHGIPCLYLATDEDTAMSEVRPWAGAYVSLGLFQTTRDLRLVDCSVNHGNQIFYLREPDAAQRALAVWTHIDEAFSTPATRSDDTAEYVATQMLAELFRDAGYDGVAYKSVLRDDGFNIALFDLASAEQRTGQLCRVSSLRYEFKPEDNPYYVATRQ